MMKKFKHSFSLPLVLVSLILATILWMYIVGVENPQRETDINGIQIQYVGLDLLDDRDLAIVEGNINSLDIRVRGRRTDLMNLDIENNISATVDVSSITSVGQYNVLIDLTFPSSVELVSQSFNRVSLDVEQLQKASIPVNVTLDSASTIAEGSMIDKITPKPEYIQVRGPEKIVSKIQSAEVDVLRENISSSLEMTLPFTLADDQGNEVSTTGLELSNSEIDVTIDVLAVKQVDLKMEFTDGGGATASNVRCTIDPAQITITGDPNTLEGLNQIVLGNLNLSDVTTSVTDVYNISLPNGITSVSGETTANVTVELTGLSTKRLICTNIEIANVPEGYSAELLTQQIDVTVRGTADSIDKISSSNIKIVVDLDGKELAAGQQSIAARVTVDGFSDVGILGSDFKINVNVTKE